MKTTLITGSGGLVGSEAAYWFAEKGDVIVGIENDMRRRFFGPEASTRWNVEALAARLGSRYVHCELDIRDRVGLEAVFRAHGPRLRAVIHTAAQPSHDWAATNPAIDFDINATGTLTMLELARRFCPEAPFVFTSTNKVYGDTPNGLEFIEEKTRLELPAGHRYHDGIDEQMSLDQCTHSIFGVSKVAADVMAQEYGRYFGMPTVCFRGGCLTGAGHSGAEQHGFLSYVMMCTMTGHPYRIYGYGGKQVRDNIHGHDLVRMFDAFIETPRAGEVYNAGGSRFSHCSVIEAIRHCEDISGRRLQVTYLDEARTGDHKWWISDVRKFQSHYPSWHFTWPLGDILQSMYTDNQSRWVAGVSRPSA
jgi:CDP-paratose 2-epimerase